MSPAEAFQSYLLDLDDESFFALMRNYLGPIKTPYHKHALIARLEELLAGERTRDRIVELITEEDRRVIAAVRVFQPSSPAELSRFLGIDYESTLSAVSNQRDRLILIDSGGRLQVNPLLDETLAALTPTSVLLGAIPCSRAVDPDRSPWLTADLVYALYAFLAARPDAQAGSGRLKKSVQRKLNETFPDAFDEKKTRICLHVLENLEALGADGNPNAAAFAALAELTRGELTALLWAAHLVGSAAHAFGVAHALRELLSTLQSDHCYPPRGLLRSMLLLGRDVPVREDWVPRLVELGILVADGEERVRIAPLTLTELEARGESSVRVHASMEVVAHAALSPRTLHTLATLCDLEQYDRLVRYRISEQSITRGASRGFVEPPAALSRIAGELPQNVRFQIARWAERARAVRVVAGIVLVVEQGEAEILESSPDFARLVETRLADGVYLTTATRPAEVESWLERLGFTGVQTQHGRTTTEPTLDYREGYNSHSGRTPESSGPSLPTPEPYEPLNGAPAQRRKAELNSVLATMHTEEVQRHELQLRIDRKLILDPAQLEYSSGASALSEARGLDFSAKVRLIERALHRRDTLELHVKAGNDGVQRYLVRPRALVQDNEELVLRAVTEPEGRAIRVRVRRVSLARRLSGVLLRPWNQAGG